MLSGVCKYCGCTETRPCLVRSKGLPPEIGPQTEPCAWLDEDETICTGCMEKLTEEELCGLGASELAHIAAAALPLVLNGIEALYLAAVLDLALRHPDMPKHKTAHAFAGSLRENLGRLFDDPQLLCTAEILRRGQVPDVMAEEPQPEREQQSTLILP